MLRSADPFAIGTACPFYQLRVDARETQIQSVNSEGIFGLAHWVLRWTLICVDGKVNIKLIADFSRVRTADYGLNLYLCLRLLIRLTT